MEREQFVPAELWVKAGRRFVLRLTNKDDITHELDIPKLRLEKKARPGQTVRLQMPALQAGQNQLIDDDSTPNPARRDGGRVRRPTGLGPSAMVVAACLVAASALSTVHAPGADIAPRAGSGVAEPLV